MIIVATILSIGLYNLMNQSMKKYFLLIVSLGCYTYFVKEYILLFLLQASLLILFSKQIEKGNKAKLHACLSILTYILGFVILKYSNSYSLPLGYSVFAFTSISYIVDLYKNHFRHAIIDILCYLFFFPKMMAGPIVRVKEIMPQLESKLIINNTLLYKAFKIILYAVFLKFVIADNLEIDQDEYLGCNLILTSIIFGIQFYIDFYAYSLFAIGLALAFGIEISENFNAPYHSSSFNEFWKRWNITLSSWLKDYIYIPLGGNRCKPVKICRNIFITFSISSLWHGSTTPFIIWGMCHAFCVFIEHILCIKEMLCHNWFRIPYKLIVICCTILLWQLFRFSSIKDINLYIEKLISSNTTISNKLILTCIISIISLITIDNNLIKKIVFHINLSRKNIYCEVALMTLIIIILLMYPNQYSFNFFYIHF